MGTGNSKASIAIQVNNPVLVPGTIVHGKVYLDVKADRVDGEQLIVRVIGAEYAHVKWTTTTKDSEGHSHTHHHSTSTTSTFLDMPYVLSSVPQGCFNRGQYEFPFQFQLPPGVLPSMQATQLGDNGGDCCVYYKIQAKLHRRGWLTWDVKHELPLHVLAPPLPFANFPIYIPPLDQPIRACCCYSRGSAMVGMHTASALLQPGQPFDVAYVIQNHSHARIKAVDISLVEKVTWHCGGHTRYLERQLFHQRFERHQLPPELTNTLKQQPPGSSTDYAMLKQLLDTGNFLCHARVAPEARFSFTGRLILSHHNLHLKICTTFGNSNPELISPMTLYSAPQQSQMQQMNIYAPNEEGVLQAINVQQLTQLPQQQSPEAWRPVIAQEMILPAMAYRVPMEGDPEKINPDFLPPPSAPPQSSQPMTGTAVTGIDMLYQQLQRTYSPPTEFRNWLQYNSADAITPSQIGQVYALVTGILDQLQITDLFIEARSDKSISCTHIVAIAERCAPMLKTELINKLAKKCGDKENRAQIEAVLAPFDYLCVAPSFQQ